MVLLNRIKNGEYFRGILITTAVLTLPAISGGMSWLFFLTPLPVIYYLTCSGFEKGLKIISHAALISGIFSLFFGVLPILLISLSLLPVGFILARGLNQQQPIQQTALMAVICMGLTWMATALLIGSANQINVYKEIINNIDIGLKGAYEAYSQMPDFPAEAQPELLAAFTKIREIFPKIFPGVLITSTICLVWINTMLGNWLIIRQGITGWQRFNDWRLPEILIWPVIFAGISIYLFDGGLYVLGLNILIVLGALYFIQGLAVLLTLFKKWAVPKPIKFFIVLFLIIQAYGFIVLAVLGIADIWANFRKKTET